MKVTKRKKQIKKTNEKGITLVALVVTIIILLILAGVSISLVFNSEGLFEKANSAASKYDMSKNEEQEYLTNAVTTMDKYYNAYSGGIDIKKVKCTIDGLLELSFTEGDKWLDYRQLIKQEWKAYGTLPDANSGVMLFQNGSDSFCLQLDSEKVYWEDEIVPDVLYTIDLY